MKRITSTNIAHNLPIVVFILTKSVLSQPENSHGQESKYQAVSSEEYDEQNDSSHWEKTISGFHQQISDWKCELVEQTLRHLWGEDDDDFKTNKQNRGQLR